MSQVRFRRRCLPAEPGPALTYARCASSEDTSGDW